MNNFNILKLRFMKTTKGLLALLVMTVVLVVSCQKETSFEIGNSKASVGSLTVDANGACMGAMISGAYYKDTTLKSSNYVDVSVDVDTAGTYIITTDTVNGYYFQASGNFNNTGTQVIRLVGGGKPLSAGTNIFTVRYNGTTCEFSINVTAPAGGSAVFTVTCTGAITAGTYAAGTALTSANTVTLNVNVTTPGSWSVTTAPAVNGITFAGNGNFAAAGANTIILTGSGTPTAAGTNNYTVTGATATCTFPITVTGGIPPDYFPRTQLSNWSYSYDYGDTSLTKVISPTHTAAGNTYNIFLFTYDAPADGFDTLGYYRRSGADYYEWGDISWGVLDAPVRTEYIFLKDNQTVGGTWTSSQFSGNFTPQGGTPTPVTLRWKMTIVQQNASVTVSGTSYANTIQVKQELQQSVSGNWATAFYLDNYFALNKGLIKQDAYFFNSTTNAFELSYKQDVTRIAIY